MTGEAFFPVIFYLFHFDFVALDCGVWSVVPFIRLVWAFRLVVYVGIWVRF